MKKIDIDKLTLKDIEKLLNIQPTTKETINANINKDIIKYKVFDEWDNLADFLDKLRKLDMSLYSSSTVYGYELTEDNHYICLYYSTNHYNT